MVSILRQRRRLWWYRTRRKALRVGLVRRNTALRVVAMIIYGAPVVARLLGRRTEIVSIEKLAPGQGVVITRLRPGEGRRTG
jgi:hypothetical protein